MILSICDEPSLMNVIRLIVLFINIIKVLVPIILIIAVAIKLTGAITKNSQDDVMKTVRSCIPNIIAAVLIFLIPTFVDLVARVSFPNSDYSKCISGISKESIDNVYYSKMESLVSKAEEELTQNPEEQAAEGEEEERLSAISNEIKKKEEEIKKEENKPTNDFSKVNYSNFKWTYYQDSKGPLMDYYPPNKKIAPYAIWAPEDKNDLNGVKLPLIVWLHGAGETTKKFKASYFVNSGTIQTVLKNWNSTNLEPIPAIIIAPHAGGSFSYNNNYVPVIYAALKYAMAEYGVEQPYTVLMGHSMGGDDTIAIGYTMYEKYSIEFGSYVSISPSHYIADKAYSSFNNKKVIEFYKTRKARGYSENSNCKDWYDWTGKSLTYLKGVSHGKTPLEAFKQDFNNNGISDLVEWMFYE